MFYAINKSTKERVNSIFIAENPSYQMPNEDIWFADPDEILNWNELKEKGINEVVVTFIKDKEYINYNGTKVFVSPHFRILNKEALGINIIPESREHKLAKNWIYNRIKNDDLILIYSKINKPEIYENSVSLKELNLDLKRLGIETSVNTTINSRRADIILPLLNKNDLWGNGIIFEVQFSNQFKETEDKRTMDWILKGYSVVWLKPEDFNFLDENFIELKNNKIRIEPFSTMLYYGTKDITKNMKYEIQEQCRLLDKKKVDVLNELNSKFKEIFNLNLDKASLVLAEYLFDIQFTDEVLSIEVCPKCEGRLKIKKRQRDGNKFIGCSNFPQCKYIRDYPKWQNGKN